jgi:hypothetical protein
VALFSGVFPPLNDKQCCVDTVLGWACNNSVLGGFQASSPSSLGRGGVISHCFTLWVPPGHPGESYLTCLTKPGPGLLCWAILKAEAASLALGPGPSRGVSLLSPAIGQVGLPCQRIISADRVAWEPGAGQDGGQRVPYPLPGGGGRRAPGPVCRWGGRTCVAAVHRGHPQPYRRVQGVVAWAVAPARVPQGAGRSLWHRVSPNGPACLGQSGQPLRAGAWQAVLGGQEPLLIRVVWAWESICRNSAGRGQGVRREGFMGQSKIRALGQGGSLAPALFLLRLASGSVNRTFVARLHSQVLCQEFGYVCCKL